MPFLDVFKKFQIVEKQKVTELEKSAIDLKTIKNYLRPADENNAFDFDRRMAWGIGDSRVSPFELKQLAFFSDILQNVFNTLKNEMFRNGFEYKNTTTFENELQLKKIERVIKKANLNNQTLIDVFKELENDLNTHDDAFLLARKNFLLNEGNEIIGGEVIEFLRLEPLSVEMVFDGTSRLAHNKQGKPVFFDVEDRGKITDKEYSKNNIKNLRACFKVKTNSGKDSFQYFDSSEIIHVSKYNPSKTYGFSPLYSLYNKIITLVNMDSYIKQYYSGNKVPKGLLTVNTSNASGFWAFWDAFISKVKKNPHAINPLIHQSGDGKDPIKWIDFMRNLKEMEYTDVRNEIRTQIGAVYNVSPIFQNDVSTGGGLNNEGLQITVTDRGVEMGQGIYNDKLLPWICEQLGVTDYAWSLLPSKEEDQVYEKDLRLKDIAIARATAELGIKVSMNETGEFSYNAGPVELQEPANESSFYGVAESGSLNKANPEKLLPKQQKEFESALLNELEKLLSKLDLKTRPSKQELDRKVAGIVKDFDSTVKTKSSRKLKAIYQKAAIELDKEIGQKFSLTQVDKNIIEGLKREPVYQKAFASMSLDLSDKLKESIVKAYDDEQGFSINRLVEDMKESADDIEFNLRNIARTETSKISSASRKAQYDKTGFDYRYSHIGPDDDRTTKASKEIKKLTKKGVSWDEYIDIMISVSKKYFPDWTVNKNAPLSHYQSRHTFIAKRQGGV